ncbi:LysR substrate-binding domain-containing protein [Sphingomonas sp. AP4-R1]|uniref:LysR substrate-binding domain-containing protein n=1 Tax=Sphingomonas sp. AP4-R1 TaxID=2735134 RepID=UPI0020A354AF|nr:LysR substrate-binding domain-containing protein [Sphingomonas sp. AP4-R1]
MVATSAAQEIAERVRAGLEEIAGAVSNRRNFDPATSRRSYIAMMSDYVAVLLFPQFLQRVRRLAPGVQVSLHQIGHDRIQSYLEEGACDFAVGAFDRPDPSLRIRPCFADGVACLVSRSHPTIQKKLTLDSFVSAGHVLMANQSNSFSTADVMCDRQLHALGKTRTVSCRAPSAYTLARIVAQTDLIGLLPKRLAQDYATQLPLQCLEAPLDFVPLEVSIIWHERSQRDPGHRWVRDHFRQVAQVMASSSSPAPFA